MTHLGTLGGLHSGASELNEAGQVVGFSHTVDAGNPHAFLWQDGTLTDLNINADPFADSYAQSINNAGQIVGTSYAGGAVVHAFLWENGRMIDLGTLPGGSYSFA